MEVYYRKFELIDDSLRKLEEIKKENPSLERYRNSWKDKDSAERNLQKTIEAIIDLGKMLVADKGLREPGNNREVFLILEENNLFPTEFISLIDKMIGMRNILVPSYDRVDEAVVYGILQKNLCDVRKLCDHFKKLCITS
jgi:uncharacterized protein YutE (UPF0331/DUF86 family)